MQRTEAIFNWVYGLPPNGYKLTFEPASGDDMEPSILTARIDKEKEGLATLKPIIKEVRTIEALHNWLFFKHTGRIKALDRLRK
jgi:hypothetical protein